MTGKKHHSKGKLEAAVPYDTAAATDPRLITIARAIGRLIAREQLNTAKHQSINSPAGAIK